MTESKSKVSPANGDDKPKDKKKRTGLAVTNFAKDFRFFWPFIWPYKSRRIQLNVIGCLLIVVAQRVVNLFVPIYSKYTINALTEATTTAKNIDFPWELITIWGVLKMFQGTTTFGGLFNCARNVLWLSAQQYTGREIQIELFKHLHELSLSWHLSRKTGEVLRVMDRGMQSVQQLVTMLLFTIIPVLVDIVIAVIYFATSYNYQFALITGVTMVAYILATIVLTELRTRSRRNMNTYDNAQKAKAVDSLLNFETVKYYNNEKFERDRYLESILTFQKSEYASQMLMYLNSTFQSLIITAGTLTGCLLAGYYVSQHMEGLTVGDYALFVQYIAQLYVPLNIIGTLYAMIQQYLIDMENMVDLMKEPIEIEDKPNAKALSLKEGRIEFRNIVFKYTSEKIILNNISFTVEPGQRVALVGPSGAGKSTVVRLLFRFYNLHSGQILMDDQDIADVQQTSLRKFIGVVPQDTVLFNDTIRYNVKYGRPGASDEDVDNAARAADIHDRIVNFPAGYETEVGERGLKLSGGEKQRVAIARTLLKAPTIVLLDEATSALDSKTEKNIQTSLDTVCKGRTTLIVAHRLSTIVDCDQILVLKDGNIVERGTHKELIAQDGLYASMWSEQFSETT